MKAKQTFRDVLRGETEQGVDSTPRVRAKRQPSTQDRSTALVHLVNEHMHLLTDTSLEWLVGNLTAEMRRRGLIHDNSDDEDSVPF
jgi:hypothetical protein